MRAIIAEGLERLRNTDLRLEPRELPKWFEAPLAAALVGVATYGLVAVLLAMNGAHDVALAALAALAAVCAVLVAWWRLRSGGHSTAAPATVFILIAVTLVGAVNVADNTDTLLAGRDPGAYVATGFWLANHADLTVDLERQVFGNSDQVAFVPPGFAPTAEGGAALHIQFPHLYGALLAFGATVGGVAGLVKTTAVLGALALLAIFALGTRLMSPWLSAIGTLAYGLGYAFTHFTRTATAEVPTQMFLFGGTWLLVLARQRQWLWLRFPAGLVAGAAAATRVDALLVVVGLFAFLCWELVDARRIGWSAVRQAAPAFLLSCAGGLTAVTIGVIDVRDFSPPYYVSLEPRLLDIRDLGVLVALGTLGVLLSWPVIARIGAAVARFRVPFAAVCGVAVFALGAYAYLLRPFLEESRSKELGPSPVAFIEALQRDAGVQLDGTRGYLEESARWIALYIGPVALLGAFAAAGVAVYLLVVRPRAPWIAFLALTLPLSALYIWNAQIFPDQPWAMRRFLLVTLPAAALLVAAGAGWLSSMHVWPRWRIAARSAAVIALAALVWAPIGHWGELSRPEGRPLSHITSTTCTALGDHAAVLVLPETRTKRIPLVNLAHEYSVMMRTACDVPVANAREAPQRGALQMMANAASRAGRQLVVASSEPLHPAGGGEPADSRRIASLSAWWVLRQLNTRSTTYIPVEFSLYLTGIQDDEGSPAQAPS